MNKQTKIPFLLFSLLFFASWASANPLRISALGNNSEVYTVHVGTLGEFFPEQSQGASDPSVVVLDIHRPEQASERHMVPATAGDEIETDVRLLYSKETGFLNVVWQSQAAGEAGAGEARVFLAHFDGSDWSAVDEIYFGTARPTIVATTDDFHVEVEDGTSSFHADRQILHLVWSQESGAQFELAYSPVILLNGVYIGTQEVLFLPHLDPDPNQAGDTPFSTVQVSVKDNDELDRVTLTFASSASQRVTTYDIEIVRLEFVHFGDLVRELILGSEDFDPREISNFAEKLGVQLINIGHRRTLRSRSFLTPSVVDFVASGVTQYVLDHGTDYSVDDLELLANDLKNEVLTLTSSLYSPPAVAATAQQPKRSVTAATSTVTLDAGDMIGDGSIAMPSHVLELRFAREMPLPPAANESSEMGLFTSDDGKRFLVAWLDDEQVLRYVESTYDGDWSSPHVLQLNDNLTRDQALSLLEQRIR